MPVPALPLAIALLSAAHVAPVDTSNCVAAAKFLRSNLHMQAIIDGDIVDDWRTGKKTPGCRITAAGGTDIGVNKEAVRFYERVRAAGWTRTPDPADAPNEGALRFRWENSDCLYHVNRDALLNTASETRVLSALTLDMGEVAYHVFVQCVPAAPAKPRG